jgi:hypothetical protein
MAALSAWAIVSPETKGKTDRNDWNSMWELKNINFFTISLYHSKNGA